jgi:hypothetical protein
MGCIDMIDMVTRGVRGMCSLARASDTLGVKHLVAQVGLTLESMLGLQLVSLGHQEPVKGLEVQAHHSTMLDMNGIVLWPVWPPRTTKCNYNNDNNYYYN